MDHDLQRRARDVFLEACETPDDQRRDFLTRACGDDADLRLEVEALLAEFDDSGPLDAPAADRLLIASDVFQPGASVADRFEVVRLLGRGGMGEVYEAFDATLKERVALKTMRAEWLGEADARGRFLREIRLARTVSHPNVCRIYDHARHESPDGCVDLVSMKLLEGATLAERLDAGRLNLDEALAMARALAEGIDAAHHEGVLHLDLKPSNVIVVEGEGRGATPVITDFGIARSAGGETVTLAGETRPIGTPQYMAPEQLRGEKPSAAADVYAFGALLYELVTGRRAFAARAPAEALAEREARTEAVIADLRKHAGGRWADAVGRCLAMDPADRPADAAAVVGLLEGAAQTWNRKRIFAAAVVAAMLAIGALAALRLELVLAAFSAVARFEPMRAWTAAPSETVVILPISLAGAGNRLDGLAKGMMQSITSRLAQFEGIEGAVLIKPASDVFASGATTAAQARSQLGATRVVEGRLFAEGDRARLTLAVVDPVSSMQIDGIVVEASRDQLLSIEDGAVLKLSNALRLKARDARDFAESTPVAPGASEFYRSGVVYLQRHDAEVNIDLASGQFERCLEIDAGSIPCLAGAAEADWHKYNLTRSKSFFEKAEGEAERAVQANPHLAHAQLALGLVRAGGGDLDEAAGAFQKALDLQPDRGEAWEGLGLVHEEQGLVDDAEQAFLKSVMLRPGNWLAYKQIGLFYYRTGKVDKAIEAYRRIVELAPDNAHGWSNLGAFLAMSGEFGQARQAFEQAVDIAPRPSTLANLAKLAIREEQWEEAVDLYQRAAEMSPEDYRLRMNLAGALSSAGRAAEARAAYAQTETLVERSLVQVGEAADALAVLAHAQVSQGRYADAKRSLQRALSVPNPMSSVMVSALESYVEMNDDANSRVVFRRLVSSGYPVESLRDSRNLGGWLQKNGL